MKLEYIKESLDDIKKEDIINLEEIENKIIELEHLLNKEYKKFDKIKKQIDIINNMINIREDKKRFFKVLKPVINLLIIFLGSILIIISITELPILAFLLFLLAVCLFVDTVDIFKKEYPKIMETEETLKKEINKVFLNFIIDKEYLDMELKEYLDGEQTLNDDIQELKEIIASDRDKRDNLKEEINFVDNNIRAVDLLIEKYKFEDMNDKTELVQFVQDKKKLKKTIEPK